MPTGPFISAFTAFVAFCKYTDVSVTRARFFECTDGLPLDQRCLLHPRRFRNAALSTSVLSRVTKSNYKGNNFAFLLQDTYTYMKATNLNY